MKQYKRFVQHPNEVGMTYNQHRRFALMLARRTFTASVASVIHAYFPFFFTTKTSSTIIELYEILKFRIKEDINSNSSETKKTITV
jgi:hypothetical protein